MDHYCQLVGHDWSRWASCKDYHPHGGYAHLYKGGPVICYGHRHYESRSCERCHLYEALPLPVEPQDIGYEDTDPGDLPVRSSAAPPKLTTVLACVLGGVSAMLLLVRLVIMFCGGCAEQ